MEGRVLPTRAEANIASLAIVVPCFGHDMYLEKMFESILRQTRAPDEVLFINDASPDDTVEVLHKLIAGASGTGIGFRLLENSRNSGQAASLNRGIGEAGTELVMVLNDDDYLFHDAVEVMLGLFNQYREVFLIGGHSIHFEGNETLGSLRKNIADYADPCRIPLEIHYPSDVVGYRRYNDLNMTHSGSCFLKSAWQAIGGYCPVKKKRMVPFSDRDFQLRLNALFPVAVSSEIPFSFWRSGSSVDAGKNS
jgi:glycosyltransferase involved in cell wall biosynthesis